MNTSKQVNVIIGLLMVGALATLLYYLWDGERQSDAIARQMTENAERGGFLFARNCSSCHGLTGKGSQERGGGFLPGAVLNTEDNRLTSPGDLAAKQARLRDTIRCGRVGTVMPAWSQEQGGPLNDFQILQLVALITGTMPPPEGSVTADDILDDPNAVSEEGWHNAFETANHDSEFDPTKHLTEAISSDDTEIILNDLYGLSADSIIRIDDDPEDEAYELVKVVDAPARSTLAAKVSAEDVELPMDEPAVFEEGDVLTIDDERVSVEDAPAVTQLASDVTASATTLDLIDSSGLERDSNISVGPEKMRIQSVSGNTLTVERAVDETEATDHTAATQVVEAGETIRVERGVEGTTPAEHKIKAEVLEFGDHIEVERGAEGSDAADHAEGAHVFNGPPAAGTTVTSETCGQLAAQPTGTPGPPVPVTGTISMTMGDNFFDLNGQRNPTLAVKVGDRVTVQLTNTGSAAHNMRDAGPDAELGTDDDSVSDPDTIAGGGTGTLSFSFASPGTFPYQCEFHPDAMKGEIEVTQ